jgi:hypothetical protein
MLPRRMALAPEQQQQLQLKEPRVDQIQTQLRLLQFHPLRAHMLQHVLVHQLCQRLPVQLRDMYQRNLHGL